MSLTVTTTATILSVTHNTMLQTQQDERRRRTTAKKTVTFQIDIGWIPSCDTGLLSHTIKLRSSSPKRSFQGSSPLFCNGFQQEQSFNEDADTDADLFQASSFSTKHKQQHRGLSTKRIVDEDDDSNHDNDTDIENDAIAVCSLMWYTRKEICLMHMRDCVLVHMARQNRCRPRCSGGANGSSGIEMNMPPTVW